MKLIKNHFNLLELHDTDYDRTPRSWIRARGKNLLKIVRKILPKNYIIFLKEKLRQATGISISNQTISDWVKGKYGIPIVALKLICRNRKETLKIINAIDFLNVNSVHKVTLPKRPFKNLFYFYGALLGDGSMPFVIRRKGEREWKIVFHMVSIDYVKNILCNLALNIFNINPKTYPDRTKGKQESIFMDINSKIVYRFFERVVESPVGKKASLIKIPEYTNLSQNLISEFIAGIFDTEGGTHMFTFGMSTNSNILRDQILDFFIAKGFKMKKWDWKNVKGNRSYSLGFKEPSLKILKFVTLRNLNVIELLRAYEVTG